MTARMQEITNKYKLVMCVQLAYTYVPQEYGAFSDQLANLPPSIQLLIIDAIQKRLKYNPCSEKNPVRSRMLRGDLYCIRRIHVTDIILLAYTVCDDCRNMSCDEKLACFYCWEEPAYRIKLIACGPYNGFYEELKDKWRSWINTTKIRREYGPQA